MMRFERCGLAAWWLGLGLMTTAVHAGNYELMWFTVDGGGSGGVTVTGGPFALGATIGQPDAGVLAGDLYHVSGGFWPGTAEGTSVCSDAASCCDVDSNGLRDSACAWCACEVECIVRTLETFADIGGPFGSCEPDGFANIHDRNQALTCFAGTNACAAINLDAGGAFGNCVPDGFCNIHDANHALTAFGGTNACSCPGGPAPEWPMIVAGEVDLALQTTTADAVPGARFGVTIVLLGPLDALQSAQVSLAVSGGQRGTLEVVDIVLPEDGLFTAGLHPFSAVNLTAAQMLVGLDGGAGVPVPRAAALVTYTLQASPEARGPFVIDAVVGDADTVLVAPGNLPIRIKQTLPAVVRVNAQAAVQRTARPALRRSE